MNISIYIYCICIYIYMYPACCIFRISFDKLYPNISKENQTSTQYLGTPISGNITGGCITLPIHKPFQLVPAHFAPGPLQLADRHKDAAIRRPATWLWHRMQPTNNVTAPRLHLKINSKNVGHKSTLVMFCVFVHPDATSRIMKSTNKHVSHAVIPVITGRVRTNLGGK